MTISMFNKRLFLKYLDITVVINLKFKLNLTFNWLFVDRSDSYNCFVNRIIPAWKTFYSLRRIKMEIKKLTRSILLMKLAYSRENYLKLWIIKWLEYQELFSILSTKSLRFLAYKHSSHYCDQPFSKTFHTWLDSSNLNKTSFKESSISYHQETTTH